MKPCLEYELLNSDYIINKCKDRIYAQHLYAAMCNNSFHKNGSEWTCSWRTSGGIIAHLRKCGEDYVHWYCSGITDNPLLVNEGFVTPEIRKDILDLGWTIQEREHNLEPGLYRNSW